MLKAAGGIGERVGGKGPTRGRSVIFGQNPVNAPRQGFCGGRKLGIFTFPHGRQSQMQRLQLSFRQIERRQRIGGGDLISEAALTANGHARSCQSVHVAIKCAERHANKLCQIASPVEISVA